MNIQRFHGATAREALAKARMAFGEGTLILSNRATANGVEVVATAEESLDQISQPGLEPVHLSGGRPVAPRQPQGEPAARPASTPARAPQSEPASTRAASTPARPLLPPAEPARASAQAPVKQDAEQLAMSTLSFQSYVRERMIRRRHEAMNSEGGELSAREVFDTRTPLRPSTLPAALPQPSHNSAPAQPAAVAAPSWPKVALAAPPQVRSAAPRSVAPVPQIQVGPTSNAAQQGIVNELQAMKDLIEERFNTMSWLTQTKQDPIQSNLMLKLIRAGYSPAMARAVMERLPKGIEVAPAMRWVMDVIERNLRTDAGQRPIYEEGGIYALVGATGVGKTTTAAKLAALCARTHGPNSVGLITLDTYRIAALEQLRAYGRMLGVVAHLAHDRAALQDLLNLLGNKKMVLIDTTGLAPRDPRKRDMLDDVLNLPGVNRLLVVNAGSHGDTLDDVLSSFKTTGSQQAVLSKIDEAVKLGPALDAIIRHQMVLRGVTNGQRVPEDWEAADPTKLVRLSMRTQGKSAFDPKAEDLNFFFAQPATVTQTASNFHA